MHSVLAVKRFHVFTRVQILLFFVCVPLFLNEHIFDNLYQTIMQYSVAANVTSAYDQSQ